MSVEMRPSVMRQRYGGGARYPEVVEVATAAEDIKKGDAVGYEVRWKYAFAHKKDIVLDEQNASADGRVMVEKMSSSPYMAIWRIVDGVAGRDPNPSILPNEFGYRHLIAGNGEAILSVPASGVSAIMHRHSEGRWQSTRITLPSSTGIQSCKLFYSGNCFYDGYYVQQLVGVDFVQVATGVSVINDMSQDECVFVETRYLSNKSCEIKIYTRMDDIDFELEKHEQYSLDECEIRRTMGRAKISPNGKKIACTWESMGIVMIKEDGEYKDKLYRYTNVGEVLGMTNEYAAYNNGILGGLNYNLELVELHKATGVPVKRGRYFPPVEKDYRVDDTMTLCGAEGELLMQMRIGYHGKEYKVFELDDRTEVSKAASGYSHRRGFAKEDIKKGERGRVAILFEGEGEEDGV